MFSEKEGFEGFDDLSVDRIRPYYDLQEMVD